MSTQATTEKDFSEAIIAMATFGVLSAFVNSRIFTFKLEVFQIVITKLQNGPGTCFV